MISSDNDVIRAVGYITIFSSYLEGEVDGLLKQLVRISGDTEKNIPWGVTAQLKEIRKLLPDLVEDHQKHLEFINCCIEKIVLRNKITHGKLIGGMGGKPDRLISSRDGSEIDIDPTEVYLLASQIDNLHKTAKIMVSSLRRVNLQ
jgi:hypothetical protein